MIAGISRPLIAFVNSWGWLLLIRFSDRIGKGLRTTPRDTLLAESVPENQRGLVFGIHRSMDNAGAVIGPLIAALLLWFEVPLRDIFFWAIIPAVIAVGLALSFKEPKQSSILRAMNLNGALMECRRSLSAIY